MAVQDVLGEETLFGEKSWLSREVGFLSKVRSDLYVLMDQGWDVSLKTDQFREVWKYFNETTNRPR